MLKTQIYVTRPQCVNIVAGVVLTLTDFLSSPTQQKHILLTNRNNIVVCRMIGEESHGWVVVRGSNVQSGSMAQLEVLATS